MSWMEYNVPVLVILPKADYAAGGVNTDVVDIRKHDRVVFLVLVGEDTANLAQNTFKVQACDDFVPTNVADVPDVKFRKTAEDTFVYNAMTRVDTHQTTAGDEHLIMSFEVDTADIVAAGLAAGTPFDAIGVRMNITEDVNDPVDGAVLVILSKGRYQSETASNVIP